MQPDTLIPGVNSPQSWNRFSYVLNNPVRFNDPTGHYCVGDDEDCVDGGGGTGPTPPIPPVNPPSGGGGDDDGPGGHSSGGISLEAVIEHAFYYSPLLGGSSSGCNTYILWNGSDWCHHTTYTPQPICLVHCSPKEQWEYALSFQYPGQSPHNPVVGGQEDRYVMGGDFISWQWLRDKGHIQVDIDGATITNSTYKTHIFHQGQIDRTVSGGYVTTVGTGTNTTPWIAAMNQYGGPVAFKSWDFLMTSISTLDKLSGGALLP